MAKTKHESENPPQADEPQPAAVETVSTISDASPDRPAPVPAALTINDVIPEAAGRRDAAALALLFDACERFNVNPSVTVRPRELAGWRYYPADAIEQTPAAVTLVTAGGLKAKHFEGDQATDPDSEERLRAVFRAYTIDPKTKERLPAPLPSDQSLPAEAVLGQASVTAHRHPHGYLRRGR